MPYRDTWAVIRNQRNDNINTYFGDLIKKLTHNILFDTYYSEKGGSGNYLEFICYPKEQDTYNGNAILVCISLCAPIAAYGQTTLSKRTDFIGWGGLFCADKIYSISDTSLMSIEKEVKLILFQQNLILLDNEFVSRQLPDEVAEILTNENHNEGNQYLHGIFQKMD